MAILSRLAVDAVRGLSPYVPGKPISELERELSIRDIIKLASNENPHGPSPGSLAAMHAALDEVFLYPDGACHDLKQALGRHLGIDPACLSVGNGSNDLLMLLAEGFLTSACNAVHSQYGFAIYPLVIRETGARAIEVPALRGDSQMPLGHDLDAMLAAIDAQTRLVFIANPNNPTGTWAGESKLKRFIERVGPDTLVILDEAYFEYGRERGTQDGLPWLAQRYADMDWDWAVQTAKLNDRQNRLGFVATLAYDLTKTVADKDERGTRKLKEYVAVLERSRLAREDTLCHDSLTEAERRWLRVNRTEQAKHWNLLTDMKAENLSYAGN